MSNESMGAPTPDQKSQIQVAVDALSEASSKADAIRTSIGRLRNELNNCRQLLGRLKGVIGQDCYPYDSRESFHVRITAQIKAIEELLK